MNLNKLKKCAQGMRTKLIEQIEQRLGYVTSVEDEYTRAHSIEIATTTSCCSFGSRCERTTDALTFSNSYCSRGICMHQF